MGNINSGFGVCCVVTPQDILSSKHGHGVVVKHNDKSGRTQSTSKMSISSSREEDSGQPEAREGFSFSSISSKSSGHCDTENSRPYGQDSRHSNSYPPPEMRNDAAEWCHSMSDEIRVAESSYDEATTEAVNLYYGDARHATHTHRNEGRRDRDGGTQGREA